MPVVVLDISSDEEKGSEEGPNSGDLDWIKHLLGISNEEDSDDSDGVIFIGEKKPEPKSKSSKPALKDINNDDDDCVVLDADPENGVTSVDDEANESDELIVVGEKGPVACRDYPHARHLCAKFPFASTPHEKHCDQCHCYVCDSLAPCLQWGTGISSSDHCHGNDKTEMWRTQRTNLKAGKNSPLPASINLGTSHNSFLLQCNEIRHPNHTSMPSNSMSRNQVCRSSSARTISSLNLMPQNQASRPTRTFSLSRLPNTVAPNQVSRPDNIPIRPTATTSSTNANGANRGRCLESRSTLVRNRHRPHSLPPRQVLGIRSHAIQRDRGSGAINFGPSSLHSHMVSNGVGSAGDAPTVNHSAHGSSGFSSHVNQAEQSDRNLNGMNGAWLPKNLPSYPSPSPELVSGSYVNQHTVASQSNDGSGFYQSCMQDNDSPSSYVAFLNSNLHENEHQIGRQSENASGNNTQCGIPIQETYQPKPQVWSPVETASNVWSPNATSAITDFTAFDSSWTENTSQSAESLLESVNQPPHVKEPTTVTTGINNIEPQIQGSHLPDSLFEFEKWLLEKDSAPAVTDNVVPSELNIHSPDLVPDGEGTFVSTWW